jgi:LacI family transcriptional regulator
MAVSLSTPPKKTTLAAIARLTGVSTPTVSKVVNGREDVAEETRAKVLAALVDAGYQSPLQRRIVTPEPSIVEVSFDAFTPAYSTAVLNGILEYAASVGVEVLMSTASSGAIPGLSPEKRAERMVAHGRIGLILVTSDFSEAQLTALRRRNIPVAVVDPLNPPPPDVVSVGATNWAGGKAAAEHLIKLGHRDIAYLGGHETAECNQARLHGYMSALAAGGATVNPEYIIHGKFRTHHGIEGLQRLIALPKQPTAIFAGSDSVAVGVLREARHHGIRIPEDLSLVGFDGTTLAEDAVPSLTSVSQPLHEMGRAALRAVLSQARGEELDSNRVELATQLVVRESTAPPRS